MQANAVITAWLAANGRKGGMKRNPRKGFGSSGRASDAARRRWELYRLRKAQKA